MTHRPAKRPSRRPKHDDTNDDAFLTDTSARHHGLDDDFAESFAEEFIATATTGESVTEDARDEEEPDAMAGFSIEVVLADDEGIEP